MVSSSIKHIFAREIIDSRGNPTIEVDITLNNGIIGRAAVPSGASTGEHEAIELRDNNPDRFIGKGVQTAVKNVNSLLSKVVIGENALNQKCIDNKMIDLDGTSNKKKLGANAILGVSMAVCRAAAAHNNQPLWKYLNPESFLLPVPMMNIINGGSHADNTIDIQEFMICPLGADSFKESLRMGIEIFHHLKNILKKNGLNTAVGDEGGFAPNLQSNEEAIEIIIYSIKKAGYIPGEDVFLSLDAAASEFHQKGIYELKSEELKYTSEEIINYWYKLVKKYPIISIEDGIDENDWHGWNILNSKLGNSIQIVGDDLTVTNFVHLQRAINEKSINTILIKLNQIGTITETIQTVELAKKNNLGVIISHRSGETEDTFIADFCVAMGMGQIKTGSASRTDRLCKYNQLLRIEENLKDKACFFGKSILKI